MPYDKRIQRIQKSVPHGYRVIIDKHGLSHTPYSLESLDRMGGYYYQRNGKGELVRRKFTKWGEENKVTKKRMKRRKNVKPFRKGKQYDKR